MAENYNAFEGLDLSNARNENETREEYKERLKRNKKVLKIYNTVGREKFQQMFPEGVNYRMFEETKEFDEEEAKKFIVEQKKNAEKLGEAK